jgi:hypothetical protein
LDSEAESLEGDGGDWRTALAQFLEDDATAEAAAVDASTADATAAHTVHSAEIEPDTVEIAEEKVG